jgi:inner membrane protein
MLGFTHALISLAMARAAGLITIKSYADIAVLVFFSLLPDIDMPYSELGKILFPIARPLYRYFGHRNITHSIIFMTLVLGPMLLTGYFFMAFLAYVLHLIADSLTYTGIPWLWPFNKNFNFLGGPIITGKWTDFLICIICIAVFLFIEFYPLLGLHL